VAGSAPTTNTLNNRASLLAEGSASPIAHELVNGLIVVSPSTDHDGARNCAWELSAPFSTYQARSRHSVHDGFGWDVEPEDGAVLLALPIPFAWVRKATCTDPFSGSLHIPPSRVGWASSSGANVVAVGRASPEYPLAIVPGR
jgi:hypothetical protein